MKLSPFLSVEKLAKNHAFSAVIPGVNFLVFDGVASEYFLIDCSEQ